MTSLARSAIALIAGAMIFAAHADMVEIEFENPEQKKEKGKGKDRPIIPTLQFDSGWPLTIKLVVDEELGITIPNGGAPFFPGTGRTGYVIFDDPDGCLSMIFPVINPDCLDSNGDPLPADETVLEFTPDTDSIGTVDSAGNAAQSAVLMEATSGQQVIVGNAVDGEVKIGPVSSFIAPVFDNDGNLLREEEVVDGYGRAADDDIPGLVLLSPHGHGVVYNTDGSSKTVYELSNLAGFVNSVAYTLNDSSDRTTITVGMTVPRFMFAPLVIADDCVGDVGDPANPDLSLCESWYQVNGADFEPAVDLIGFEPVTVFSAGYSALVEQTPVEISAMVVSGLAPNTVQDIAAPFGEIDEEDLAAMGYTVIGDKETISVDILPSNKCFGLSGSNIAYRDFDGNGVYVFGDVCPASAGSLSRPPR